MNNTLGGLHVSKHVFYLLVPILLFCSCTNNKNNLFYYSGNQKIEFVNSGDTLGFLLKDTILNIPGDTTNPAKKIQLLFDSILNGQGYDSAGNLTNDSITYGNVKLRLNKTQGVSLREKERVARDIKRSNRTLVAYSGYLVRDKNSNRPFIVTDEIIVEFNKGTSQADIDNVLNNYNLEIRKRNPFVKLQFTVAVTDNSPEPALIVSQQLKNNPKIRFAQINLIHIKEFRSENPADEYFSLQWHHSNNGSNATVAMEDADIDTDSAWNFTKGAWGIKMAVFDQGLDVLQEDLISNYSHNLLERPWNNLDDDANLMIDDTIGWNFFAASNNLYPPSECVGSGCYGIYHGTAVMGLAAAHDNTIGVRGVCPECSLIPIRIDPVGVYDLDGNAIAYARTRGARIFVLCWSYASPVPANILAALADAIAADILVFVAMSNSEIMDCADGGLTTLTGVFAVSRSNSLDMYDFSGFGDCVDLLAPSGSQRFAGLAKIATTDVTGDSGRSYFDGSRFIDGSCTYVNRNYTTCFGGTSAATPIVAGAAGLILSANPMLSARQVQNLLQDCADKIDTTIGRYSPQNGRSTTGRNGYGRLNAYEAVKIASTDLSIGGRNGVDIFLRDNRLDWGNTEKPSSYLFQNPRSTISHWTSMDIKVDAPPYEPLPAVPDNHFFEALPDENPIGGRTNRVYVRVRNRGFRTAGAVIVNLYWVHAGASLPALPSDFWDRFPQRPNVVSDWNSLGTQPIFNLEYSGASIANTALDAAQIVSFDFDAPVHDPSTRNHYCLMAIVSSSDDSMPTPELLHDPQRFDMDYVTTHFNNATHRNYNIENADASFTTEFYIYNPTVTAIQTGLEVKIKGEKVPVVLSDSLQGRLISLNRNEKRLVRCTIDASSLKEPVEITIQQTVPGEKKDSLKVIGGITYFVVPSAKKSTAEKK